ncbi:MAG: glycosyltransferase family 9 protein [Chlorobi bacterium]|nr:glycosyltransferase family 9 protein [Chlorobiota bacterium]MCI0716692.1 glycosyltransferase family 9 protein [Chlorobiota bacterium]
MSITSRRFEKLLAGFALRIFRGFVVEKDIDPAEIDHSTIRKILIVVRHQMGDMLCSVPMMRSVRDFYPNAHITLVTKKSTRFDEIFKDNNSPVNDVKYYERGMESFLNLIKELQMEEYDLAIVPSSVIVSGTNHLIAYYSKARYRAGIRSKDYEKNKAGYVLNIKDDFIWDLSKVHQIERNLDIIRLLNINPLKAKIDLTLRERNIIFAGKFIGEKFPDDGRILVGIHPGAGKEQNVWAPEKFSELAFKLSEKYGAKIFVSEGPDDEECVSRFEKLMTQKYADVIYAKHKGDLMNNLAIISKTNLFITNDTGVMHLAAGADIPLIALFGPTKAYEWGPIGENEVSIQGKAGNVNSIETDTVFETCMRILGVKTLKSV